MMPDHEQCELAGGGDMSRRNIVITGFMATGKSTVAREVARQLGRPLLDMDDLIAQRAGVAVPEIFARYGEEAFRRYERALCAELGARDGLVIATGGGTLVEAGNREALAANGLLVCLDCELDELLRRLEGVSDRPMLWGDDPGQRLCDLLRARRPAYAQIPYHLDGTSCSPAQVAQQIIALFRANPRVWHIATPTGRYPVYLLLGGIDYLGSLLRARGVGPHVVAVSDEHIWPSYGDRVVAGLRAGGYAPATFVLPAGEQYKTLDTVRTIYDRFVEAGLDLVARLDRHLGATGTESTDLAACRERGQRVDLFLDHRRDLGSLGGATLEALPHLRLDRLGELGRRERLAHPRLRLADLTLALQLLQAIERRLVGRRRGGLHRLAHETLEFGLGDMREVLTLEQRRPVLLDDRDQPLFHRVLLDGVEHRPCRCSE